ncbi:hypothetical protein JCM10207_004732 [Rhodosporidiobolus poonsookiae]
MRSLVAVLGLYLAAHTVDAFWRLPCQPGEQLVYARADPIVNPGALANHVHTISGASNFNLEVNFHTLRESQCTSCQVKQDMSNYWTPALYFAWRNGSFTLVDQGGVTVYYFLRSHANDQDGIKAFPDDLRMLSGNPYKRSAADGDLDYQIGINCLNGNNPVKTRDFPTTNCPDGMRMEVMFPSCWDGERTDSTNHQDHMAFPDEGENGPCPSTHPHRLVTLFYEIWWTTAPWEDKWEEALDSSQPFVLSMGDPTGYGLHGDFLNGWDSEVLQQAIDECTSDTGVIEECKVFDLIDYTDMNNRCYQSSPIDEEAMGTLQALPGCNPLDAGPDDVTTCNEDSPPAINKQVTLSGGLAGSGAMFEVVTTSGGSQPQQTTQTSQASKTNGGSVGSGDASATSSKASGSSSASHSAASSTATTAADSSSPSSSSSTDSSSSSDSTSSGNMKWYALGALLFLLVLFVIIRLSIRFQCGRRRKRLDKTYPPVESYDEEKSLNKNIRKESISSASSASSDLSDYIDTDEEAPPLRKQ